MIELDLYRQQMTQIRASIAEAGESLNVAGLKEQLRTNHILRLQQGNCGIDAGFIWSDLLTNLERVGDHCSNIACCMIDSAHHNMNMHETLQGIRMGSEEFNRAYAACKQRYSVSST